jgi:hypothetical protein
MKWGIRKPSFRKRLAARTSVPRFVRHSLGFKAPRGYGWLTNPRRCVQQGLQSNDDQGRQLDRVGFRRCDCHSGLDCQRTFQFIRTQKILGTPQNSGNHPCRVRAPSSCGLGRFHLPVSALTYNPAPRSAPSAPCSVDPCASPT